MGGYVGRCVVVLHGGCMDAYVWHDGQFPFTNSEWEDRDRLPVRIHLDDPGEWIEFGERLRGFQFAESNR